MLIVKINERLFPTNGVGQLTNLLSIVSIHEFPSDKHLKYTYHCFIAGSGVPFRRRVFVWNLMAIMWMSPRQLHVCMQLETPNRFTRYLVA